ncbi:MAG: YggT family protein [Terrisporobacter othiniensis]|uniref:YggT family protein n=2 Tax=Terrisporobacter TaxID=1505652 RepID=A0AAX2ZDG1_9FIRM|nr:MULTISPECIES: YggT family protein [Terrisporobacter]MBN9646567.1 YggT family protein [Terrisporobacter glycolicus]MDU4859496.1 YggT family protein [Terrisporobacter othiniensis]MDU6993883.1 YggT family protein [Terrisporobacter othiniensis]UEL46780.1 YggT family protein [Terrisporobacter hibernicus]UPA29593.1 YggT family protein [Terrisporobacter glycolicus]
MQMIAVLLIKLLNILTWLIIIQCLMSWFPGARYSKVYEILSMFTEPLVGPIREVLFRYIDIPIDFSPIIAFFVISIVQRLIMSLVW